MKTINYALNTIVITIRRVNIITAATVMLLVSIITEAQTPPFSFNGTPGCTPTGACTQGSNGFPFNVAAGKECQWLVLAGEFNTPSPAIPGNITNIWFQLAAGTGVYTNLTIKLGQINDQTDINWTPATIYTGSLTTVYNAPSTTITSLGAPNWVNITLTTPFLYDPTKALIVDVSQCLQTGGIQTPQWTMSTGPRRKFINDNDATAGCLFAITGQDNTIPSIGLTVIPAASCSTPTAQATGISLTPGFVSVNGSFTAASPAPNSYLVVRYPAGAPVTNPVDGVSYTTGSILGLGTVVQNSASTTFVATGLTQATPYDFYVYSMNGGLCFPNLFLTASPLFASVSTTSCESGWSGIRSVGPTGFYPDLTTALADINTVGLSGPAVLELQPAYDGSAEPSYPVTLSSNICISAVNNLTIRPEAAASGLVITSANTTATVRFNGGQNVTIDGRPGGVGAASQLSIRNTATTGNAIQMVNESSNNTIKFCDLQGQNTSLGTLGTASGVVFIGGTTGTNGNDNNTIANCDIHETSTGFPTLCFYSFNSSAAAAAQNDNNTITGCNVFNFFNATSSSTGIKVETGCNNWTITNNNVYQTATRTYTVAVAHRGLWITPNTAATTAGSGFIITGNFVGGTNAAHAGIYTMTGTVAYIFDAMDIFTGLGTASSVQNNTIANISMTATTTSTIAFVGINLGNGNVDVGNVTGNTIGSSAANGSITFITASSGGGFMGIRTTSGTGIYNISNNTIAGVNVSSTLSSGSAALTGINTAISSAALLTVNNNIIGSALANSLQVTTLVSGAATMNGILNSNTATAGSSFNGNTIRNMKHNNGASGGATIFGYQGTAGANVSVLNNTVSNIANTIATTGIVNITGISQTTNTIHAINSNTISNITSLSTTTSGQVRGIVCTSGTGTVNGNTVSDLTSSCTSSLTGVSSTLLGISYSSVTAGTHTISGNTIHSLTNNSISTTALTQNTGFAFSGTTTTYNIEKNSIHSLNVTAVNPNATITGMDLIFGTYTCRNNMIRLGLTPAGADITAPLTIRGITTASTSGSCNIIYNSVFIGGINVATGTLHTRAFNTTATLGLTTVRDNIFVNNRSNAVAGSNKHYAVFLFSATNITLNNNLYNNIGTGGVFGTSNNGASDQAAYVASWAAGDAASLVGDPQYLNPSGTFATGDLHINSAVFSPAESKGINIAGTTDDFDSDIRQGNPGYIGAGSSPDIGADEFSPAFDAAILWVAPTPSAQALGMKTITVKVVNGGTSTITSLDLQYTDGFTTVNESFTGLSIPGGTFQNFSFATQYDLTGASTITASIQLVNGVPDLFAGNNSVVQNFCIGIVGTYTVNSGLPTGGTNFNSVADALAAVNSCGIAGATIIEVPAGYAETAPTGGFILGSASLNSTFSAANTLTIRKDPSTSGVNPLLTAPVGTTTNGDGIFKLNGADFVTIDGIDLQESAANLTTITQMEWGYALVVLSATDGSNNNTIQNCTITLNKNNFGTQGLAGSHGIFSGCVTTANVAVAITAASGSNSNNKFYHNAISNVNLGIYIAGNATVALNDQNNDVGGSSAATGNIITNFGSSATATLVTGIYFIHQNNANASFNTVDNALDGSGAITASNVFGIIHDQASTNNASFTANNNNVTVTRFSGAGLIDGISSFVLGTGTTTINNNTVRAVTSGDLLTSQINLIRVANTTGTEIVQNNNLGGSGMTLNTNGQVSFIFVNSTTLNGNISGNFTGGNIVRTVPSASSTFGIINNALTVGGAHTVTNNNISNMSLTGFGAGAIRGISYIAGSGTGPNLTISGNTVSNISSNGTGTLYPIQVGAGNINLVSNNTVSNISGGGQTIGLLTTNPSTSGTITVQNNTISNIQSNTQSSQAQGMQVASGPTQNIIGNKISDVICTGLGVAYGLVDNNVTAGTTTNIINNILGRMYAPNTGFYNAVQAFSITGSAANTKNIYFNTVYLDGAVPTASYAFRTDGIVATLTLRNNIFINNIAGSTVPQVAYFHNGASLAATYSSASNNNIFYAGTPGIQHLIYCNGTFGAETNKQQTLASFQTYVGPARESNSKTELTNFLSYVGTDAGFLHINTQAPSQATGGAENIAGITSDIDGDVRAGNAGYLGSATNPYIGADESCSAAPVSATATPATVCTGVSTTLRQDGGRLGEGAVWKWYSGSCGGTLVGTSTAADASLTIPVSATKTYFVRVEGGACSPALVSTCSDPVTVTFVGSSVTPSVSIVANPDPAIQFCQGTLMAFTATSSGGGASPTYDFKVNGESKQNSASTTFATSLLVNNDVVTCVMTPSSEVCATSADATSNAITVDVQFAGTLFSENFNACTNGNFQFPACNWTTANGAFVTNNWSTMSTTASCNMTTGVSMSVSNNVATVCAYTNTGASDKIAYKTSGSFSTVGYKNLTVSFDWAGQGEAGKDYMQLCYNIAGTPSVFSSWVALPTQYNLQPTMTREVVSLPSSLEGLGNVYIGFRWVNDAIGGVPQGVQIDNIAVNGIAFAGTPVVPDGTTIRCASSSPTTDTYTTSADNATQYNWTLSPPAAGTIVSPTTSGSTTVTWNSSFVGLSTITVTGSNCVGISPSFSSLDVIVGDPTSCIPSPSFPANNATNVSLSPNPPTLSWPIDPNATSYDVYFSLNQTLVNNSDPSIKTNVTTNALTLPAMISGNKQYFWKVVPKNPCGNPTGCATWNFTTETLPCNTPLFDISLFPGIAESPGYQVCSGTNFTDFSVAAHCNNAVLYRWYKNNILIEDGGNISGATTANIQFNPITTSDAGEWRVDALCDCPGLPSASSSTYIVVDAAPVINSVTATPSSFCSTTNSSALHVDVTGDIDGGIIWSPPTYLSSSTGVDVTATDVQSTTTWIVQAVSAGGCRSFGSTSIFVSAGGGTPTVLFNENFNLCTSGNFTLPFCSWSQLIVAGGGTNSWAFVPGTCSVNGSSCIGIAGCTYTTTTPTNTIAYKSGGGSFSTVGATNVNVQFIWRGGGEASGDYLQLCYNISGTPTVPASWVDAGPTFCCNNPASSAGSVTLPAAAEGQPQVYIGFRFVSNGNSIGTVPGIQVDNIQVIGSKAGALTVQAATPVSSIECGASTTISATGGGNTFSWTSLPAGFTSSQPNITVSPRIRTTYTVIASDACSGATGSASITIDVTGGPVITASASPSSLCIGGYSILTASAVGGEGGPPFTFTWNPTPELNTLSGTTVIATPAQGGVTKYTVNVMDNIGCGSAKDISVTVGGLVTVFQDNFNSYSVTNLGVMPVATWDQIPAGTFITTEDNEFAVYGGNPASFAGNGGCSINTFGTSDHWLGIADMLPPGSYIPCTYNPSIATDRIVYNSVPFSTLHRSKAIVSFKYRVGGEIFITTLRDYAQLVYTTGDPTIMGNWIPVATGGFDGIGNYYNTPEITSASVNLPVAALEQNTVYLGFRWVNDNNAQSGTPGFMVDDIKVEVADIVGAFNTGPYCKGDNIVLTASPADGSTYSWTGPNGFTASGQTVIRNIATAQGGYEGSYQVTIVKGSCNYLPISTDVVVDPIAPVITSCPTPVTVQCSAIPAAITTMAGFVAAGGAATDNCAIESVAQVGSDVISGQTCQGAYTITRTYRVTDTYGNSSDCAQTITVFDNTAPVITCPANITFAVNAGNCGGSKTGLSSATATDNCSVPTITWTATGTTPSSGTGTIDGVVFPGPLNPNTSRVTTVTWKATDACGNTSTCTQTVTVTNAKPVVTRLEAYAIGSSTPTDLVFVNQNLKFKGKITDETGTNHTWVFNDDAGTTYTTTTETETVLGGGQSEYVAWSSTFFYDGTESRVAEPSVVVTDGCNANSLPAVPGFSTMQYLAVATPTGGYTTHGGNYIIPSGALLPLSGQPGYGIQVGDRINVGDVSKYTNNNQCKGQLQHTVHGNNNLMNVHVDNGPNTDGSMDYLTISNPAPGVSCAYLAVFRAPVKIDGITGNMKILVAQTDGEKNPVYGAKIRVKIGYYSGTSWGTIFYDTQPGAPDGALPTTPINNGKTKVQPSGSCRTDMTIGDNLEVELLFNVPNPTDGQTDIKFNVPQDGKYTLKVYNYLGQEVATLFNDEAAVGMVYTVKFDGSALDAGIYTYAISGENYTKTAKLNLIK